MAKGTSGGNWTIRIEDHSAETLKDLEAAKERILESWGQLGVTNAVDIITDASRIDTDAMRGSFSHQVQKSEDAVYVGSPISYAKFHEWGTGTYHDSSDGKQGRKGWWVYVPGDTDHQVGNGKVYSKQEALKIMFALRAKGLDSRITQGVKPLHMLKNGIGDHISDFKKIAEDELKK